MTLIVPVFPKLQTGKDLVRQMSKKLRFRTPFDSQHVKESQRRMKSEWQYLYHIFSSPSEKSGWKMSLLLISKLLGLFVKTLTVDNKYSLGNIEILREPFQMQLSKRQTTFSQIFAPCLISKPVFDRFEKKIWPSWLIYFRIYGLRKTWLDKCLKSPVKEHPSTVNMPNTTSIFTASLLSNLFITLGEIQLQNLSVSDVKS